MPSSPRKNQRLLVTVVSRNASTLEGLDAYLRGAGVATTTTGAIERLIEMTPPSAAAVILFPDEYSPDVTIRALATLKKLRPDVLAVIVTNEPRRFVEATGEEDRAASPLVMPKPAWAWTILDAARARLDAKPREAPRDARPSARGQGRHE
jgi:hypothetical protein